MPKVSTARIFCSSNLITKARVRGAFLPYNANTPYVNTIPVGSQPRYPGDRDIERRISSIIRWNAVAMVLRANKNILGLGGHIASFQSAATLYDVGFNHFWRAPSENHGGDIDLYPGTFLARDLRPRFSGRAPDRGTTAQLPPRS